MNTGFSRVADFIDSPNPINMAALHKDANMIPYICQGLILVPTRRCRTRQPSSRGPIDSPNQSKLTRFR